VSVLRRRGRLRERPVHRCAVRIYAVTMCAMKLFDFLTGRVSPDTFARDLVRAFAQRGYGHARYDAQKFAIDLGTPQEPELMFLGNFYPEYCQASRFRRSGVLGRLVDLRIRSAAEAKANTPSVDKLLPVIRDVSYTWFCQAQVRVVAKDAQHRITGVPIGNCHQAMLVLDSLTQTQQVDDATLAALNLGFDEAMAQAIHNLRGISPDKWRTVAPGAYMGAWDDIFDCSRILLTDLIYRLNLPQNPVALMPARGVLLVTSSTHAAGQLAILTLAAKLLDDNAHWISAQMLELTDGIWKPFAPSERSLRALQHRLHVRLQSSKYEQQKGLLEAQLAETGKDIFVATYMAYSKGDDVFSLATWSQGVEAWLPKADYIMFVKPGPEESHDAFSLPWDVAHQHAASWMVEVPDVLPLRYHVTQFPDAALLDQLRAQQAPLGPVV